ncbi:MAG: SusC/RagA family TonB-linked outer membrane protein [Cyclobacteriaceae bacterium]
MKRILLLGMTAVLMLTGIELWAQERSISGRVTDADDGAGLPGVNVVLQGTTNGTVTDADGAFNLNVPSDANTLVFTFVGMATQEIQIGGRTVIDVLMSADVSQLSEVVVTALGITREKASLGYSTQQIDNESVTKAKQQNFINSLSGKVAGVQIRTNNTFGGSTNIVIRGNKSVTGNNQPLFVVDGVPVDNSTGNTAQQRAGRYGYDYGNAASDINPDDIESINILKGAAASALYGSRAANGVVMVTTKKGKKRDGLGISISSGVDIGTVNKDTFVKYQNKYGAGYARESFEYYGPDGFFVDDNIFGTGQTGLVVPTLEDGSYGAPFDPNLNVYHWDSFVKDSPNYQKAYPWTAAKNTPLDFFSPEIVWNNSIALTGGSDKSNFRLSYTNYDMEGIMPLQDLKKHTISFNGSSAINDKLTADLALNFVNNNTVGRPSTGYGDNQMANFRQWWQTNVDIKSLEQMYLKTGRNITWNGGDYYDPETPIFWDNPYWTRYKNFQTDERTRLYGNIALNYKATDWLNVLGRITADTYTELREERRAVGSVPTEFGINLADEGSGYQRTNRNVSEYNYDLILTFNKQITTDLSFTGLLGGNIRKERFSSIYASTQGGLVIPNLYAINNSVGPLPLPIEAEMRKEVYGVFANATLGLKNFLYLDLQFRNDISSALPVSKNSYPYHSEALSFIFSELFDSQVLDFGKVRVNYAEVGNDTSPLRTTNVYTKNDNFGGAVLFSYPSTVNNSQLVPENLTSIEAGLELAGVDNRLKFDLSFYKTISSNQIISVELSKATGASFKILNGGEIENKGMEVALGFDIVKSNALTWNASVNWAKNISLVNSLATGITNYQINSYQGGLSLNATVGQPYGVLRGTGYQFLNGQRVINAAGYPVAIADQVIGNPNPDWNGGLINTVSYKGLALSFLIDVSRGGDVYSLDMHYGQGTGIPEETAGMNDLGNPIRDAVVLNVAGDPSQGYAENSGGIIFDGVKADGSQNNVRARADFYGGAYYWGNATRQPGQMTVYDASYVKLREVSLSYSLPKGILGNTFQNISISAVGRNLWIIDKNVPYSDPEAGLGAGNAQGYLSGAYPALRNIGFKVNLGF